LPNNDNQQSKHSNKLARHEYMFTNLYLEYYEKNAKTIFQNSSFLISEEEEGCEKEIHLLNLLSRYYNSIQYLYSERDFFARIIYNKNYFFCAHFSSESVQYSDYTAVFNLNYKKKI